MNNIKIWAHRGASGYALENTIEAFEKAIELKADGIELDVQFSKDKHLVVVHDESLQRLYQHEGFVKDYTYQELLAISNNTMCELAEVLELIKKNDILLNIELKTGVFFYEGIEQAVIDLVNEYQVADKIIYSSFNHATLLNVKKICPTAKTGLLYADGIYDILNYAQKLHVDFLHPALYNIQYPDVITQAHAKNLKVNVWTVNDTNYVKLCQQYQVDTIITNYPDLVRKTLYQ